MGFKAKTIRWYKESVPGEKPAAPDNFLIQTADAYGLNQNYPTQTTAYLGTDGEASPKLLGTPSYEGSLGLTLTSELLPMILVHSVGDATLGTYTAPAWAASTVVADGDIVAHSDGTHMLWAQAGGTTGSTEPDLTGLSEFDTIDDNGVTWVVRKLLRTHTGQRAEKLPTFGVEMEFTSDDATTQYIYERYGGLRINTVEFMKSGDDIGLKITPNVVGMTADDSVTNSAYVAQGGVDIAMSKLALESCSLEILIDDVKVTETTSVSVPINRNISIDKCVSCGENVTQLGVIEISGKLSCLMDKTTYARMANREVHKLTFRYQYKGDLIEVNFNKIQFDRVSPGVEASKYVMFESTFSGYGTPDTNSVTYSCRTSSTYGV